MLGFRNGELGQDALLQRFTETSMGLSNHLIKLMQGVENEIEAMVRSDRQRTSLAAC